MVLVDAVTPVPNLGKLCDNFGIAFNNDMLILSPDDPRAMLIGQNVAIVSEFDDFNPVTRDFARQSAVTLAFSNARSIRKNDDVREEYSVKLVAHTSDVMIRVKDVATEDDLKNIDESRIESGSFPVIAVVTGKSSVPSDQNKEAESPPQAKQDENSEKQDDPKTREMRMVVAGSVHFANNQGATVAEHRDLFINIANYLLEDEDFISIRPKDPEKSRIALTSTSSQLMLLLISFVYPFLFLGGGLSFWLSRRRA